MSETLDDICAYAAKRLEPTSLTFALVVWVKGEESKPQSVALSAPPEFQAVAPRALMTTAIAAGGKLATDAERLRERCHHVVELLNGQEFAEDLKGEDVQCLTLWAWSPAMVDAAQRDRVIAFFAGREQACIEEGDTVGGTDARARAVALIATMEG